MSSLEEVFAFQVHTQEDLEHVKNKIEENPQYNFSHDDAQVQSVESKIKLVNEHVADTFRKATYYWFAELFTPHLEGWKLPGVLLETMSGSNSDFVQKNINKINGATASRTCPEIKNAILAGASSRDISKMFNEIMWYEGEPKFTIPIKSEFGDVENIGIFSIIRNFQARDAINVIAMKYEDFSLKYAVPRTGCFDAQMNADKTLQRFSKGWSHLFNPVVGYIQMSGPFDTWPMKSFLEDAFKDYVRVDPSEVSIKRKPVEDYFAMTSVK
jgi:hypothetical protein